MCILYKAKMAFSNVKPLSLPGLPVLPGGPCDPVQGVVPRSHLRPGQRHLQEQDHRAADGLGSGRFYRNPPMNGHKNVFRFL